jgi:hypothetical protein
MFLPIEEFESARHTDQYYEWKDRLLTAVKLLPQMETTLMERLQIQDAADHAKKIDPKSVVPYCLPNHFFRTFGLTFFVLIIALVSPSFNQQQNAIAKPLPEIIATAATLQEELVAKIDELAEKNPEEKNLKELSTKLKELVNQLNESATDPKEALSTLSEMEEAIRSTLAEFQLEAVDTSMKEIAEAMSVAEATRAISQALKNEKYNVAAEELKKFDAQSMESMSKQERNAVADQMKTTFDNLSQRNQELIKKSAEKMSEGLKENDGIKVSEAADELAAESNKQALRKGISEGLEGKLALLSLSKSECNGSGKDGGQNNGGNDTKRSDSANKNWGTGAAGNPNSGTETQLDGKREQKNVTGMVGKQGDSEYEKINSSDASQEKNVREHRESFQEYRKAAEAVLESEPIPLGQRQMIRRYFESIRPNENNAE